MIVCARRPGWTEATVTDRCARSTKVKSWHINRWRPGGLNSAPLCRRLSPACPRPLTITHTDCQLLHQVDKPFSSSGITDGWFCLGKLRLWRVGKTGLFVPPCFSLFLFFFPPSLSVRFGKLPGTTAATRCEAEDDWIYPVAGVHCRPGAAVGSFSRWKSPFTHPLSPHEVSRLFTWSQRHFTDRRTFQRFHKHWQEVEFKIRWGFDYMKGTVWLSEQ